jgi:hypothetical protein
MARQRKPMPIPLSQIRAGDAFLAPLQDGRLCVCRVLQVAPDNSRVLVAASSWIGTQPPDPADPTLREILSPTYHFSRGKPYFLWVCDPVPATFTRLGRISPTNEEASLNCEALAGWEIFPLQVFLQWRWDHERDQMLAEDEATRLAEAADTQEQRLAYKPLQALTLQDLRKQTPFSVWAGFVEPALLRRARGIIRDTIDALIELGPDVPEPVLIDEINQCVERFNELDEEESFINTIEREDICQLIEELADLVGLEDYGEALHSNRDW